jgi:L-malate glycosyltransferase
LPALLASPFIKARIAYFRHNSDEDYQANPVKAKWMNRILNRFKKRLVAPSQKVWQHWVKEENVSPAKIMRINYGYNFEQYEKANPVKVKTIQEEYPCRLRIVSIARFVPAKRHVLMFRAIEATVRAGIDCKLICIGTGPDEASLKQWVADNNLAENIFIIGYCSNIFDYLEAADLYLHLSSTEASNSSVKEAGLVACPCIVCRNVGDFEDYIVNGQNGFLVSNDPPVEEVMHAMMTASENKEQLKEMGKKLKTTIVNEFDIQKVVPAYEKLITSMSR